MTNDEIIGEWYQLRKKIDDNIAMMAPTLAREMELRRLIVFRVWGEKPKEGTNKVTMPGGWTLKGVHRLERKVDETALPAVREQMRKMNVNPDTLIRNVPELQTRAYRLLTDEQRKVFDQALVIKPSAPSLELNGPK